LLVRQGRDLSKQGLALRHRTDADSRTADKSA
jgi:hypothetical protein